MYPQTIIQEIKDRVSIVGYIGEIVPLKKAGHNFKGLCPFHQEKSPSFMVHDEKQIFHCFGCGEGGDLLHFVMKHDSLNFPEAVRQLAERAGVTLPELGDTRAAEAAIQRDKHRRLLLRVNEVAASYFQQGLLDPVRGKTSCNYLESRGFNDNKFFTQHFLGSAEEEWEGLVAHLRANQVPLELAVELGLIRKRAQGDGHYDFFRSRLIFPIRNPRGEVIAFGGRVLPGSQAPADSAKYLNSSDSLLFRKGETLYGFPAAAQAMRSTDRAILVEGYMDVLALHRVGIEEAVAPLGTALTAAHLRLIARYTRNLWITFDGDEAGRQAARRSLPTLLDAGLIARVVVLPDGEDPDTIVSQDGAAGFESRLASAPTLFEWVIQDTLVRSGDDTAGRVRGVEALRPYFARLRDPIEEATYVKRIAQHIDVDEVVIRRALGGKAAGLRAAAATTTAKQPERTEQPNTIMMAERNCLEFLLQVPDGCEAIVGELQPDDFQTAAYRDVAERYWHLHAAQGQIAVGALLEHEEDAGRRSLVTELAFGTGKYDELEDISQAASEIVSAIRRTRRRAQIEKLNMAIAQAEQSGAVDRVNALMAEKQTLLRDFI